MPTKYIAKNGSLFKTAAGLAQINLQDKTVTPTASGFTVSQDSGYSALNSVVVNGDENLVAENIKNGIEVFGVTGTLSGGGSAVLGTKSITANGTYNAVDDSLDGYSAVTVNVSGEEPVGSGFRVRFIDYDGTVLKTEYVESGNDATPPDLPTHENLTFQSWNGAYTNITATRDLSAHYTTTDGKIYLTLEVNAITGLRVYINFTNGGASCDWGDGNTSTTESGTFPYNYFEHTYASAGRYTAVITPDASLPFVLGSASAGVPFIAYGTQNRQMAQALIKLHIGGNVSMERDNIFNYSYRLMEVNIPSSIASIGGTFANCYSLKHITIPSTLTALPTNLFYTSKLLKSYVVPDNITSIGNNAFTSCPNLTEVVLPSGLESIGNSTFNACPSLTEVVLPSGLKSIGNYAFYPCYNLTEVVLPSGLKSIGDYAFSSCPITEVVLPSGLTTMGTAVFQGCSSLEEIIISSGMSTIQTYSFSNCSNCKKYVILKDNGVVTLSNTNAFLNINYDAKIYVPDALVDAYKVATNWVFYADYIYPLSEMV